MASAKNDGGQLEFLFTAPSAPPATPGALNLDQSVRAGLAAAIKASSVPRAEIAARMAVLTGRPVTVNAINSWTAPARHGWQFPFSLAVAFEVALDTYSLTELHNAARGCKALIGSEALLAEWGRLEKEESRIKSLKRALRQQMGAGA